MIGLFCKRALSNRQYSAKETYNLIKSLLIVATPPHICVRGVFVLFRVVCVCSASTLGSVMCLLCCVGFCVVRDRDVCMQAAMCCSVLQCVVVFL